MGQDLWRGPSRGVATLICSAPDGIQVLSNCGETEVRDQCITRVIHEDVWLAVCEYSCKTGYKTTYSFEVPMDNIAGVEIAEATGDVGYLASGMSVGQVKRKGCLQA